MDRDALRAPRGDMALSDQEQHRWGRPSRVTAALLISKTPGARPSSGRDAKSGRLPNQPIAIRLGMASFAFLSVRDNARRRRAAFTEAAVAAEREQPASVPRTATISHTARSDPR